MMFCSPPSTMMSIVLNEKWELYDAGSNSRKTSVALKAKKYMSSFFSKRKLPHHVHLNGAKNLLYYTVLFNKI
jgi:hypothetical protein